MPLLDDTRELKISCTVSALYYPQDGTYPGGNVSAVFDGGEKFVLGRKSSYAIDNKGNRKIATTGLVYSNSNAGTYLPTINTNIGAPECTFVYGALAPEGTHPVFNLIKGPKYTVNYASDLDLTARYSSVYTDSLQLNEITDIPTVLTRKNSKFPDVINAIESPNIWSQDGITSASDVQIIKYHGYKYGPTYKGSSIRQVYTNDGSAKIYVSAINSSCILTRLFSVKQDLANNGAKLSYSALWNNGQVYRRSENINTNGFSGCTLTFDRSSASKNNNPNSVSSVSGIVVELGDVTISNVLPVISFYRIEISDSKIVLKYYHPLVGSIVEAQPLNFSIDSNIFKIHMYFVGSNLMIGTSDDPSKWDTLFPLNISPDSNYNEKIIHSADKINKIKIQFNNINCSFTYAPIAFKNFDTDSFVKSKTLDFDALKNKYKFSFKGTQEQYLESFNAEKVNEAFNMHKYRDLEQYSDITDQFSDTQAFIDKRSSDLSTLKYYELSKSTNTKKNTVTVTGYFQWNTTIEGPCLRKIVLNSPVSEIKDSGIVDLNWGDLSPYFDSVNINYNSTNQNFSSISATANLVLKNLDTSDRGARILEAIENNVLLFTIKAGYDELYTYYQGINNSITVERSATGSIITISLKDMTSILEETRFTIPYIEFGGMQYLDIIKRIILSAGFQNQFSFQETSEDPLFSEYTLALRNQVSYGQYSVPDAGNFSARSDEFILPKINNILNQCLNYRGLPSFVWNPELRYFQLTWRYEPSFGDVLYFIGERETFGVDFAAGSEGDSRFPKNWHGVLSSNYTITSKISSLAAGLEMYGQAFDSTVIGRNEFYDGSVTATDTALTELGIQRLNDCVDDRTIVPSKIGYVGYRKFHLIKDTSGFLQDYTGLNIYFKQVKRIIRNSFSDIKFTCIVSKPLTLHGTFAIQTFIGNQEPLITDRYLYTGCTYVINKKSNIITAEISGAKDANVGT
jgi:hypothetical protein